MPKFPNVWCSVNELGSAKQQINLPIHWLIEVPSKNTWVKGKDHSIFGTFHQTFLNFCLAGKKILN